MDASKAWDPLEFCFTDPDDVARYGDRWFTYSEPDLIRRSARELIELEAELGMPLVDVMNGARMRSVLGNLAAAWLGVRDFDPKLAGPFDEFTPLVMLINWRAKADEGKAEAGTEPEVTEPATQELPATGSPEPGPSRPETSEPTDLVVLQTSPVAG
jgi:hypothetical protein